MRLRLAHRLGFVLVTILAVPTAGFSCGSLEPETVPVATGADQLGPPADAPNARFDGEVEAASTSFCAGRDAAVCTDFSIEPVEYGGFNTQSSVTYGGTLSIDGTQFLSPPSALKATTPAIPGGGQATAILVYTRVGLPRRVSVSGSFRIADLDPAGSGAPILTISTIGVFATLNVAGAGICTLEVTGPTNRTLPCGPFPTNVWKRLELTITFPNRARVSLDNTEVLSADIPDLPGDSWNVLLGLRSSGPVAAQTVYVDNVLIERF